MKKQKIKNASSKFGRNQKYCQLYRLVGRKSWNKARKIRRHLKSHPNDNQAALALK